MAEIVQALHHTKGKVFRDLLFKLSIARIGGFSNRNLLLSWIALPRLTLTCVLASVLGKASSDQMIIGFCVLVGISLMLFFFLALSWLSFLLGASIVV